jgi:DNA-directed RNA polymerase sigma subunit (sigma70/sigma32)
MKAEWRWLEPVDRDKRDARIRELYALGLTWQELADEFDLSKPRIRQIVLKG